MTNEQIVKIFNDNVDGSIKFMGGEEAAINLDTFVATVSELVNKECKYVADKNSSMLGALSPSCENGYPITHQLILDGRITYCPWCGSRIVIKEPKP